ncbi:MAG: putative CHY-type Zn-finger protein [Natronomonas sp.]|jgi:uncharacterized CHY-type Zn-finger protein
MHRPVGDWEVHGVAVGPETRCAHYQTERDVIALRFGCCARFYPCLSCHGGVADHEPEPWPRARFEEPAVLCGVCGSGLSARAYLNADHTCPACGVAFNPGCADHYDQYFEGF